MSRKLGESDVIKIVFTQWWQGDLSDNSLQNLIAEFENQHEGIRIILNYTSFEDIRFELFNYDRSDSTLHTDVIALDPIWVPELLARGIIKSADAPILSFINVLYYNIDILRKAGFTRPPATRSEFLTFARAVSADGIYALTLSLGSDDTGARGVFDTVYPWIWASGAPLLQEGMPVLTSPQVVATLDFLSTLNAEGLIAPASFTTSTSEVIEDFITGKTAFMVASSKHIPHIHARMGSDAFSITAVPPPSTPPRQPFFAASGWGAGVYAETVYPREAGMFAAFLSEKGAGLLPGADWALLESTAEEPLYSKLWETALSGEVARDFSGISAEGELETAFALGLA
ncbi:MAG: extracellular solute-binding protein, partial [Treponema sp.]|nr:extracellular solute-binding protein [Treponema sp.]